jgi:hypothetical protein
MAQKTPTPAAKDPILNTDVDYDELFNELDDFLDSLLKPRSYAIINIGGGTNFYDYTSSSDATLKTKRQLVLSPSFSYYDKSGLGISLAENLVREENKFNPYQFVGTLSYDYLKNTRFVTGIAATHFFTKDSLSFYTTPLKNELFTYFSYRGLWLKPTVSASYGWGSRTSYEEREEYITSLRLKRRGYTRIDTEEKVRDLNITASVRHDFYWLDVFTSKDYCRLSPQVSFTSGTQHFGFNQTTTSGSSLLIGKKESYRSENLNLDNKMGFQPLSIAASLKGEFSIGKFFVQPQYTANYYLPGSDKNLSGIFTINTGLYL